MSFVIGGLICVVGQIIIDTFKKNNAYLLVFFVVTGAILGFFGVYDKLVEIGEDDIILFCKLDVIGIYLCRIAFHNHSVISNFYFAANGEFR
jgi:hypothetical protein